MSAEQREGKTRRHIYSSEKAEAMREVAEEFGVKVRVLAKEGQMYIGPTGIVF
jgi:SepF-like predicted cell division protein (DUF552 family)